MPWRWDGQPAVLQSRAWDEAGNAQPLRAEFVAARGETKKPVTNPLGVPQSALQQPHELGHRRQRGDQACLRVRRCSPLRCCADVRRRRGAAETPKLGKPITEADIKAWDITVLPDGTDLPPGSGTRGAGRAIYRAEVRRLPRRERQGRRCARRWPLAGGAPLTTGIDAPKTIANFWAYATTRVRLHRAARCRSTCRCR